MAAASARLSTVCSSERMPVGGRSPPGRHHGLEAPPRARAWTERPAAAGAEAGPGDLDVDRPSTWGDGHDQRTPTEDSLEAKSGAHTIRRPAATHTTLVERPLVHPDEISKAGTKL